MKLIFKDHSSTGKSELVSIAVLIVFCIVGTSCENANFKSSTDNQGPESKNSRPSTSNSEPDQDNSKSSSDPLSQDSGSRTGKDDCDFTKDFVALSYPADIQTCVNSGKLYDFHQKKCFDTILKASSFECTKEGVKDAVKKVMLGSKHLTIDKFPDAKLIGCGEARGGKTIVLQWWVPPKESEDKCSFSGTMTIGTECYVSETGAAPSGASNTAEGVSNCAKAK